jgi:hypothetical protein
MGESPSKALALARSSSATSSAERPVSARTPLKGPSFARTDPSPRSNQREARRPAVAREDPHHPGCRASRGGARHERVDGSSSASTGACRAARFVSRLSVAYPTDPSQVRAPSTYWRYPVDPLAAAAQCVERYRFRVSASVSVDHRETPAADEQRPSNPRAGSVSLCAKSGSAVAGWAPVSTASVGDVGRRPVVIRVASASVMDAPHRREGRCEIGELLGHGAARLERRPGAVPQRTRTRWRAAVRRPWPSPVTTTSW